MKRKYLILLLLVGLLGCDRKHDNVDMTWIDLETSQEEAVPDEIQGALKDIARRQAKGLEGATTKVNAAYNYTGFSYLEPIDGAKLVSVDVEFFAYDEHFDLDDVDIIDGDTDENYGSDPHIVLLNDYGVVMPDDAHWPEAPGPLRVLLIYALPKQSMSLKLGYWGALITDKRTNLVEGGPKLTKPVTQ